MTKTLKTPTDPLVIRSFIMYDVLLRKSVFEGYQNLRVAMGVDVISFPEYEFWYYRFYDGNLDVNYDRSADPKPVTFDDLPREMVEEILEKLDLKSRLTTRKVCRKLLQSNGPMSGKIERIGVTVQQQEIKMRYNDDDVVYANYGDGSTVKRERRIITVSDDYVTRVLDDLKIVLEISKTGIKRIMISLEQSRRTQEVLKFLQKIHTEGCVFHVQETHITAANCAIVLSVLELFKPEVLKDIDLNVDVGVRARCISELATMEQFKKAKAIDLQLFARIESCLIFTHFQHFEAFYIRVHSMNTDQIVQLRNMLIGSAHFKKCTIDIFEMLTPVDYQAIRGALGQPETVDERRRQLLYHLRIPNSDGAHLEFKILNRAILVTRHDEKPPAVDRPRFLRPRVSSSSSSSSSLSSSSDSD